MEEDPSLDSEAKSQKITEFFVNANEEARNSNLHIGWNKTIQDLNDELQSGKRRFITGVEAELAREYEVNLLPTDTCFPKSGETYEATEDYTVSFMANYAAPASGGGVATFPKGERVQVGEVFESKPLAVVCLPLRYEELHSAIVPAAEREFPMYSNYHLTIRTADLNRFFILIPDAEG